MRRIFIIAMMGTILIPFAGISVSAAPGDMLWSRTYGGSGYDVASSVQQTTDGGYIVAGYTASYGAGGDDFYLVKTDANGTTSWTATYGGGSSSERAYSVQQTNDGGYILAGSSSFDSYLVKTDADGDTVWTHTYARTGLDKALSVQQTTDGGYIVAGHCWGGNPGDTDFLLIKTDTYGDTIWTRTYGGNYHDVAYCVQQTDDGGYIVAGEIENSSDWDDFYLVKTDANGNPIWTRTYGNIYDDCAQSVQQTDDGGYIVAGWMQGFGFGSYDFYLVKTDSIGDTLWTHTYGGSVHDYGYSVQQTTGGGYIVAGYTWGGGPSDYDFYLVKTDTIGNSLWTRTYGGSNSDLAFSVQQTSAGGYIVAGYTYSDAGRNDMYLVRVSEEDYDIDMVPDNSPVVVPAGGSFGVTGIIGNPCDSYIGTIDVWYGVQAFGNYYEQGSFQNLGPLAPYTYISAHLVQSVPWYAPAGNYIYKAWCGSYPFVSVQDSAWFTFTVTADLGGADEWICEGGEWLEKDNNIELPGVTALSSNYPNPFNCVTNIGFDLVNGGNMRLDVYNLKGQLVETLIDGYYSEGNHNIKWDASHYSSGIYFYKLTKGDDVFTKRMTLLK